MGIQARNGLPFHRGDRIDKDVTVDTNREALREKEVLVLVE